MSNQISTFNFKSNPVRIETVQNEPYFCLTDVCSALAINNANSSRFRLNEEGVHKMYTLTNGGKQELIFINEPNLYRIIFRSNKAEAVEFQNWVFEEVLPQIRKTGQYSQNNQPSLPLVEEQNRTPLVIIRKDSKELKLFLRLLSHAHEYSKIQEAIRNGTNDPRLLPICQHLLYQHDNGDGFMFSFKANVQNDINQAGDLIAHIV